MANEDGLYVNVRVSGYRPEREDALLDAVLGLLHEESIDQEMSEPCAQLGKDGVATIVASSGAHRVSLRGASEWEKRMRSRLAALAEETNGAPCVTSFNTDAQ